MKTVHITALTLALSIASACNAQPTANDVFLKSDQNYLQGQYTTSPSVWSRYLDPSLKDYDNLIHLRKNTFPNNTYIYWKFPNKFPSAGVYGYNYVSYGQYWNVQSPTSIPSRKLADIGNLTISVDVRADNRDSDYNILSEFFITRQPNDINSRIAEIGWLMSAPQRTWDYFRTGKQIGTFEDRFGRKWICASHNDGAAGLYIKFMPADGKPRLRTEIDALSSLKWLIARKSISPQSYFNGAAIGIEPIRGSGSATIDRFQVSYR